MVRVVSAQSAADHRDVTLRALGRPQIHIAVVAGEDRGTAAAARGCTRRGQAFLTAEISNSRVTLSLTRTPPVSSAAFQVMP